MKATPYIGPTILSALIGDNSDLFPKILTLYAKEGARIIDATYGRGVFWKKVDQHKYDLVRNDLVTAADIHCDYGELPFEASTFDMFVLDPPYMHAGGYKSVKRSIQKCYQNDLSGTGRSSTHKDNVASYVKGIDEARRLLKKKGVLVLKGMDEIESGKQRLFLQDFSSVEGFIVEDIFVLVRKSRPAIRWPYQYHARKNHSYFMILRKTS